jgi:hypothetical protein
MVAAGSIVLAEESRGRAFRVSARDWLMIVAGGLVLIISFCWDWPRIAAGGMPARFPWEVFSLGEALGLGGFLAAWRGTRRGRADGPGRVDV